MGKSKNLIVIGIFVWQHQTLSFSSWMQNPDIYLPQSLWGSPLCFSVISRFQSCFLLRYISKFKALTTLQQLHQVILIIIKVQKLGSLSTNASNWELSSTNQSRMMYNFTSCPTKLIKYVHCTGWRPSTDTTTCFTIHSSNFSSGNAKQNVITCDKTALTWKRAGLQLHNMDAWISLW